MSYKIRFLSLLVLCSLFFSACGEGIGKLPQSSLIKPATIIIEKKTQIREIFPEEEAFELLYKSICSNWWKTNQRGTMVEVQKGIPQIQALCDDELLNGSDIKICFVYETPLEWFDYSDTRKTLSVTEFLFLLPPQDGQNTQGEFLISQDHEYLGKANRFEYFYNNELYDIIERISFK